MIDIIEPLYKKGLARFKTMFRADKLEGPYREEAKQFRLNGLKEWFRTKTGIKLSRKLTAEIGLFD